MGFDYFVFYTEASLVCIVILSMILITDRMYNTKQEKQLWFGRAIISFILYFISDACWAAMLSGLFPKVRFFAVFFNFTNFILLSVMAYGMFMFIAISGKMSFGNSIMKRKLFFLPTIISLVVICAAYLIDPLFWIDENNELNTLYYPLMFAAPFLYLLASFVFSVIYAVKSELREEKRRYVIMGTIPIGVMAFGMLQVVILNAPTFCFGCTIMWLWYYIQNTKALISIDDLTHLNNRGQINRYMEQLRYSRDSRTVIMMIDINKFKGINDRFGHAEGDRALIIVSGALKEACSKINASVFLGRYGGDEFTIIIQNLSYDIQPSGLVSILRKTLAEKKTEYDLKYDLDVSIGYDEMRDESDTAYACMNRADDNLYIDKKSYAGLNI